MNNMASRSSLVYQNYIAVTPDDATNLIHPAEALYIGVSGDVTCVNAAGTAITFTAAPVGVLPVRTTRVNLTGTAATDIVALF
jgi:hypothetical protein